MLELMLRARGLLAILAANCLPPGNPATTATSAPSAVEGARELPLTAGAPDKSVLATRALEVPGFLDAVLYSPPGQEPRPLLVAAHGAGGSPEWECEYWRRLTKENAFVLCLRGTALGTYDGFYFRDQHALERELIAAERAARTREPRILLGSGVYAGFSQGSSMGSAIIAPHAAAFPYLVLTEGFELWNVPRAKTFARAGGKRVLFACGSKECAKVARASLHWFHIAGVEAKLEFARGMGHTPLGEVMTRINSSLPWLLDGDPLWP